MENVQLMDASEHYVTKCEVYRRYFDGKGSTGYPYHVTQLIVRTKNLHGVVDKSTVTLYGEHELVFEEQNTEYDR